MNINKYIKNIWVAACILMGGTLFNSCTDELDGKSVINTGTEGINLSISVDGMREKVLTRAETSDRKDKSEIHDLHIILASGDKIKKVFSVESTETGSDQSETSTGLESDPSFAAGKISYHISQEDAKGADHVYVVANYIDESGAFATFPITEGEAVSALQDLKQGYPSSMDVEPYCTMFGEAALSGSTDDHGHPNGSTGSTYDIELTRTLAMITVGINGTNLRPGVVIKPTNVRLINVPNICTITGNNAPTSADDIKDIGPDYPLGWDPVANLEGYDASTPSKPHDIKAEDVVALYMFENNQGTNVVEGGETAKQPAADKKEFCSYIEITADYRYYGDLDTQGDAPSNIPNLLAGTIFYRFYLGKDITSSFEVMRNTHYQLTLNLSDWAGLVEDGKITNGSYKPGNTNVSWRVDTDLREIDEGFVDTELNLPIGGCRFDVIVATSDIDKLKLQYIERGVANYPDEVETGNNDTRWIFVKKQDGWTSSGNALNGNFDAKNNEDGTYTLSFYAKPWTKTDIEGIVDKHPDLNNMDAWLKSGYRYTTFKFTKSGEENATLTVRQWLPIPVMEPGLSGDKPADANLYYSRFDIANGNELRWGPTAYDAVNLTSEGDNHGDLVTTGLGIDPNSDVPSGEFNPEYGFHNQVAFFITDRKRSGGSVLDFNAVLNGVGTPSMLDYATFISANAEEPGTDEGGTDEMVIESASEAHGQHHYALASKEEWEKIERYGVLQNFLPIPYWTSNMEGTESYVYIYGSGGDAELRPRSKLYRGRMVYHKNNDAHF